MEAKLMDRIKEQLVRHEGLKPYRCTAGKLTIGIGCYLDYVIARRLRRSNGLTQIFMLL
jgi:GH24 family phage-related lysozyme (muramidase)